MDARKPPCEVTLGIKAHVITDDLLHDWFRISVVPRRRRAPEFWLPETHKALISA